MTVPVLVAAKRMGIKSSWSLSNLRMQKLLYIAHMFHLGRYGSPLVDGGFEAWDLGPVHPVLYHEAKIFGSSPVKNIFRSESDMVDDCTEAELIDTTVSKTGMALRPGQLVAITHWTGGAWYQHYVPNQRGIVIPNEDILLEYEKRKRRHEERAAERRAP